MKTTKRKRTTTTTNGSVPQKGEPGYLTPTQLRNRRKRRAKKTQQQDSTVLPLSSSSALIHEHETSDATTEDANKSSYKKASTNNKHIMKDPSMKYIQNPIKAPIVRAAKNFFQTKPIQNCTMPKFRIHVGPLDGWRTVAKLAVRSAPSSSSITNNSKKKNFNAKVAIGLFLPQSHTLLPVPNCRAHHPSINHAVECIEKACHDVGVVPYQESISAEQHDDNNNNTNSTTGDCSQDTEKGMGQLRYVAINVARESGAVQITLVWNASPPPPNSKRSQHGVESIDDPVLQKLVSKLLSMSSVNIFNNKNPSSDHQNENDREATTSIDDASSTCARTTSCTGDISPMKKRRRRGRHEGKSTTNDDSNISHRNDNLISNNNNSISKSLGTKSETSNDAKHHKQDKLKLHSIWINYNQSWKHSNAIFAFDSTCWEHVYGPHAIIEHLNFDNNQTNGPTIIEQHGLANPRPPSYSIPLHFPPNVFRQANLDSFTNIVGRIRERMQQQFENCDNTIACVELYGGVGTIGLHVSDMVTSLVSSDENPNNSACFYDSVRTLPADIQSRLVYKQLNAADMVTSHPELFQSCQVLIVDPPRKGLDIEVVDFLCKEGWKTMHLVVYVSCGFSAFQRDCEMMLKSGKWKIEFAEGYLLFPGSDAIETLAFFVPSV